MNNLEYETVINFCGGSIIWAFPENNSYEYWGASEDSWGKALCYTIEDAVVSLAEVGDEGYDDVEEAPFVIMCWLTHYQLSAMPNLSKALKKVGFIPVTTSRNYNTNNLVTQFVYYHGNSQESTYKYA